MTKRFLDKLARRLGLDIRQSIVGAQSLIDCRWAKGNSLLYVGAVGLSNLGDEVVLEVARRNFPTHRIVAGKENPRLQRLVLQKCLDMRLGLLVGGGTIILADGLLVTLERCAQAGMPFVCLGTGVHDPSFAGPLDESKLNRWRAVFKECRALGVRGPYSKRKLDEMGVPGAEVVGDAAVLYAVPELQQRPQEPILGVNVGTAWGRVWGNDENGPLLKVAETLRQLRKEGWKFRFFCVWPYDLPVTQRLMSLAGVSDAEIVEEYYSGERFIQEVSVCRAFVAMKLHAVILSVCAGVPTVALEYSPKLKDFMASIQSESEVLRWDKFDSPSLRSTLERVARDADAVALRQWSRTRRLSELFRNYIGRLQGVVSAWRKGTFL